MFLLQIINHKKFRDKKSSKIKAHKKLLNSLERKITKLKQIKGNKALKSLYLESASSKEQNLISYIVNFTITNRDTILYVTDIKGNLKFYSSASLLRMAGKQKTKQPAALLKVLRSFMLNIKLFKSRPVALHFFNTKKQFAVILVRILEKMLFIKLIKLYSFLLPHNGCRPKKIRRKKYNQLKFK